MVHRFQWKINAKVVDGDDKRRNELAGERTKKKEEKLRNRENGRGMVEQHARSADGKWYWK